MNSPTILLLPAALLLLSAAPRAQVRTEAVPANHAAREGDRALPFPFARGASRTQVIVDRALLAGLGKAATVTALSFRPDGAGAQPAGTADLEVILSTPKTTPAAPAIRYAGNRGADARTVLPRTRVNLPAAAVPAPPPSAVRLALAFTRTFPWSGGGLCLEVVNYTAAPPAWRADAPSAAPWGFHPVRYEGNPCPGGANTMALAAAPWPGAPVAWQARVENTGAGASAALLILGAGLQRWGGLVLPFALDPLLGTKGCTLYTDHVLGLPARPAAGRATVDLGLLPPAPALAGAALTAQWLLADASLPGGLGASNLARAAVGSPPPLATLHNHGAPGGTAALQAEFLADTAPVLFLRVQ
jgi:hypothetical protein